MRTRPSRSARSKPTDRRVVVAVAGATASVESAVRSGSGEAQLEGRVESLPPTMPALTFKGAGRSVRTDASTVFTDGGQARTFTDLRIGMRVHAKGSLAGDTFTAARVELQNSNTALPVNVNGTIDTVTGTAGAFQFNIGSRRIRGDAQTVFFGDGDRPDSFASLKEGCASRSRASNATISSTPCGSTSTVRRRRRRRPTMGRIPRRPFTGR